MKRPHPLTTILAILSTSCCALNTSHAGQPLTSLSRRVNWYVDGSKQAANLDFVRQYRSSMTGLYLCCGRFAFDDAGALVGPTQEEVDGDIKDLKAEGLELLYVMDVAKETLASQAWAPGVEQAAEAAASMGFKGFIVDYEPEANYTRAHATAYAQFLSALTSAMHKRGLVVGFNVADWGILNMWDVYLPTGADIFTSMTPTYDGSDLPGDKAYVQGMIGAGVAVEKVGVGIGTMLASGSTPEWDYKWTEAGMRDFVGWLSSSTQVSRVDFWRADIDRYQTTAPYVFEVAKTFLNGPAQVLV